jgi:hypothetical protein
MEFINCKFSTLSMWRAGKIMKIIVLRKNCDYSIILYQLYGFFLNSSDLNDIKRQITDHSGCTL